MPTGSPLPLLLLLPRPRPIPRLVACSARRLAGDSRASPLPPRSPTPPRPNLASLHQHASDRARPRRHGHPRSSPVRHQVGGRGRTRPGGNAWGKRAGGKGLRGEPAGTRSSGRPRRTAARRGRGLARQQHRLEGQQRWLAGRRWIHGRTTLQWRIQGRHSQCGALERGDTEARRAIWGRRGNGVDALLPRRALLLRTAGRSRSMHDGVRWCKEGRTRQ